MNTLPRWVSTTLQPEEIRGHSIIVKDKTGRQIKGHLQLTMVSDRGQSVVSACYSLNPDLKRSALAAFYLTQEQMDAFTKDGEQCVLDAPANPSRWA